MSAVTETRYGILQYLPDEPFAGQSIAWYGEFLQLQMDLLARIVRPGMTLLEVGAGVGLHTLALSRAVGDVGTVIAYESRPVMRRILRQNARANLADNVTIMTAIQQRQERSTRTEILGPEAARFAPEPLDKLQLERLDVLKISAGIPATDVLRGAEDTFWRLRPISFMSASDETELTKLEQHVKQFGYRCWRMDTLLFNPENFNRRDADIFAGRLAIAMLAMPEEIDAEINLAGCVELSG